MASRWGISSGWMICPFLKAGPFELPRGYLRNIMAQYHAHRIFCRNCFHYSFLLLYVLLSVFQLHKKTSTVFGLVLVFMCVSLSLLYKHGRQQFFHRCLDGHASCREASENHNVGECLYVLFLNLRAPPVKKNERSASRCWHAGNFRT